jgi:hypothetical protein
MGMQINSEFPSELDVDLGDGTFMEVGIEYPWRPLKCSHCNAFGHFVN